MNINQDIMSVFTEKPKPNILIYNHLDNQKIQVSSSWNPATNEIVIVVDPIPSPLESIKFIEPEQYRAEVRFK